MCVTRRALYMSNPLLNTIQVTELLVFSVTFYQMSAPYVVARRLYHRLCSAAAYDPYVERSKTAWPRILEYYHDDAHRYSLHFITRAHNLSFVTHLNCLTWFVSCCLYAMNLLKHLLS